MAKVLHDNQSQTAGKSGSVRSVDAGKLLVVFGEDVVVFFPLKTP